MSVNGCALAVMLRGVVPWAEKAHYSGAVAVLSMGWLGNARGLIGARLWMRHLETGKASGNIEYMA